MKVFVALLTAALLATTFGCAATMKRTYYMIRDVDTGAVYEANSYARRWAGGIEFTDRATGEQVILNEYAIRKSREELVDAEYNWWTGQWEEADYTDSIGD
ncbi:MAG: hypothetical protein AAGJ38_00940 [Planctomycetota bacterium]